MTSIYEYVDYAPICSINPGACSPVMKCLQFRKMAAIEDSLYSEEVLCDLNFTDLESYKKYGISCVSPGDGLKMRPLEKGDFDKGYIILLSQLTKVGEVDREKYEKQFDSMKKCPGTYYTTVIEVSSAALPGASASRALARCE